MSKLKGAGSGLAGGVAASLFGLAFLWHVLYLMEVVVAVFQGEQIPTFRPFYTLEQAGGFLLIVGFFASMVTLLLWTIGGAVIGHFTKKQDWQQSRVLRSWLTWGMSFAVVCLIAFVFSFWSEGSISNDPEFLRVALFLFVWWTVCGLGGGAVSAKLLVRWTVSKRQPTELNLPS